jgi:hypothetical protein
VDSRDTPLAVAQRVGQALEALGAGYFLGGSLASSVYGEPRSTQDIDIVTDLRAEGVDAFAERLGPDFNVDVDSLGRALRLRQSWNIHYERLYTKIDLFSLGPSPFDQSEFDRRFRLPLPGGGSLFVKSPEDSVLRKLRWFRDGGEVSERQWRDVVEILRRAPVALDAAYMEKWAPELGVVDLLAKARAQAPSPT